MLSTIWNTLLVTPIFNILVVLYQLLGSLGFAIILLTVIVRAALLPIVIPSLQNAKKQRELQPHLAKLKSKYKDKTVLAQKQMELFKEHGINPASGCLSQVVMLIILFALYGVIRKFSSGLSLEDMNAFVYFNSLKFTQEVGTKFLYLDLTKPDPYFILAILAGGTQLIASLMMLPYSKMGEKEAKKTPDKKDDLAYNMQSQMLYMFPIMNAIVGARLPAGVVLYLITTSFFMIGQNYFVHGLGGLEKWVVKVKKWIKK